MAIQPNKPTNDKAKRSTEQVLGNGQDPDVVPAIDDDAADVVDAGSEDAPRAREEDTSDAAEPVQRPKYVEDEARAAIAKRYRELRDKEESPPAKAEGDDLAGESQEPVEGVEPAIEPLVAPTGAKAGADDPQGQPSADEVELTVHGTKIKKPLSEVIADAQKYAASQNILEEVKQLRQETKALRDQQQTANQQSAAGRNAQPQPDPSQTTASTEHPPAEGPDLEKLRQIVERIQVGDADDGAQALIEFAGINRPKPVDPQEVDRRVDARLAQAQQQAESQAALSRFADKFQAIATDPLLAKAGEVALSHEIIKDLKTAGISDELINPLRDNVQALAQAQRQLRGAGHQLRSYDQLLDATGEMLSTKFGIKPTTKEPAPSTQGKPTSQSQPPRPAANDVSRQERVERKRAATQQPRAAGVRGAVQPPPRPKTARDIVAEQRKARGFPAN